MTGRDLAVLDEHFYRQMDREEERLHGGPAPDEEPPLDDEDDEPDTEVRGES